MKATSVLSSVLLAASAVNGHGMWQQLKVDGADKGSLNGLRVPNSNNPVQQVTGSTIACNTGLKVSNQVIPVPAGAKVSAWFQHVIGGPQFPNDPDNPIAPSHKGPITVYLAKVDNAGSASDYNNYNWFKVAEEGLDNGSGKWAVDTMIQNKGWWDFTMPSCVSPGQYLMRIELLALHSAYSQGGAQFYISCANIEVTGSGTKTGTMVKFPGAYKAADPGITISIYQGTVPNNSGKPYTIPGPAKLTC